MSSKQEDLMARIAREIPEMAGTLSVPRVTYVKSSQKTYISFECTELAGERQFLKLERVMREMLPGRPLAVRVTSPALKTAFLEDPAPYRQVLDDFLRRNYPMARAWIGQIGWQIEKNQLGDGAAPGGEYAEDGVLTLVFPDEISLRVMNQSGVGPRLAMAIKEIFAAKVRVETTVEGTREERLRKMMEQRRDTALTVTAEEMAERYGTGVPAEGAEKAEKKPRKPAEKKAGKHSKKKAAEPSASSGYESRLVKKLSCLTDCADTKTETLENHGDNKLS